MPILPRLLPLLLLITCYACSDEDPIDNTPIEPDDQPTSIVADIGDSEIPYVIINTSSRIINEPKISAEMFIYENQTMTHRQPIGIEYRGSTSYRLSDKKSYGIETWDNEGEDVDVSLLGFPEEEDWILNGQVVDSVTGVIWDGSLMHHHIGYEISRRMGKYASRSQYVELQINGDYKGIYTFMEKLKRDKNRIDINKLKEDEIAGEDVTGGYILKIDKTSGGDLMLENLPLEYFETNWGDDARYQESFSFRSHFSVDGDSLLFEPYRAPYHELQDLETYFIYEYPDADDIADEQKAYIQNYIYQFEKALLTDDIANNERSYTEYIDVASFVDYFIINELCRNVDAYRLSTYLQKDKNEKLQMGPVWDINIGFADGGRVPMDNWVMNYNQYVSRDTWLVPFWWPRLMSDPTFRSAIKSRWQALRSDVLTTPQLTAMVDEVDNYLTENGAIERNAARWSTDEYRESVNRLKRFLADRAAWMDSEINSF